MPAALCPRRERAQLARPRLARPLPPEGPGQRRPPSRARPRGSGATGPGPDARSLKGWGAGLGEAPVGAGQSELCQSVRLSVKSVGLSEPRGIRSPGGSAAGSPATAWEARQERSRPGPPGGPPGRSEGHGSPRGQLVGAEEEARAAAAASAAAASSKSHPRALPSLAGCLGGSGPAREGGGGGGAARGWGAIRAEGGGVFFEDGEGAEREGGPPASRQPRELGTLAVHPACGHLAPPGPSPSPGGVSAPGVQSSRLRATESFVGWEGWDWGRASPGGREAEWGSYSLKLGSSSAGGIHLRE